jgi:hypothetical protein
MDLAVTLEHAAQADLLKDESLLDHAEWMFTFSANMRFGSFDKNIYLPLRRVLQHLALSMSHGQGEADTLAQYLWELLLPSCQASA